MARNNARPLRIFQEQAAAEEAAVALGSAATGALCATFTSTTGWSLKQLPGPVPDQDPHLVWAAPINSGDGTSLGHLRMDRINDENRGKAPLTVDAAQSLAEGVARQCGEVVELRQALSEREAELAAGVPLVSTRRETSHLAERLDAMLTSAAQMTDCQAAAIYLIDESTSHLKLRSAFGLPESRLLDPPRPLRGSLADLEALLGHAVVLENDTLYDQWNVPERFGAAVCVPIAGPTVILGTLWIFSENARDFTERDTNLIEMTAGRVAAELDREMLWNEVVTQSPLKGAMDDAVGQQRESLPNVPPLVDGFRLTGRSLSTGQLPGTFYDWMRTAEGKLMLVVGNAAAEGGKNSITAAITAVQLRAAWRAHAEHGCEPADLVARLNEQLWSTSAGNVRASIVCASLDELTGSLSLALGGEASAMPLGRDGEQVSAGPMLGLDLDSKYTEATLELAAGESLALLGRELAGDVAEAVRQAGAADEASKTVDGWAETLADALGKDGEEKTQEASFLILRRAT